MLLTAASSRGTQGPKGLSVPVAQATFGSLSCGGGPQHSRAFSALKNAVSGLMGYGKGARRCHREVRSKPVPDS